MSGKCICKPGIIGDKCDICPDGTPVTPKGCNGCKIEFVLKKIILVSTDSTMCDFHNFGLIFAGQMHCLPQRLKSTFFEKFSNTAVPKEPVE